MKIFQRFLATIFSVFALTICSVNSYAADSEIVINEVMSNNEETLKDEDGDWSDWIELYNTSSESVNLSFYKLSQDPFLKKSWTFPSGTVLGSKQYLRIFASNKDRKNPAQNLHTDFKISSDGEEIILLNASGSVLDRVQTGKLFNDRSLGRFPDGIGSWYMFKQATPGASNSTKPMLPSPRFSLEGGFYNNSQLVNLYTDLPQAKIQYTLFKGYNDIGEPIIENGTYQEPFLINKTTVIRAYCIQEGFDSSPTVANTYFINFDPKGVAVVSVITDRDNLYDRIKGIYIKGANNNYLQDNMEVPAHVEFYNENGELGFGQSIGLSISGNSSRNLMPRPLALKARGEYNAPGKFKYKIFPKKDQDTYNGFVLRNSSQDGSVLDIAGARVKGTYLRNNLMADLNRDLTVDFRDSINVIVFLEGELWGIANLQEDFGENYIVENHQGLDKNHIDLLKIINGKIKSSQLNPDNPIITRDYFSRATIEYQSVSVEKRGIEDYLSLLNFIKSNNMADPSNYAYVKQRLNINNTIDYFVAQIYSADMDWPNNNIRVWRDSRIGINGLPGPWHYIYADSDYTFNLVPSLGFGNNTIEFAYQNTIEFKPLLQNPEFKKAFLSRMANYLNGPFKAENVLKSLKEHRDHLEPVVGLHLAKWWGNRFNKTMWEDNVRNIENFVTGRAAQLQEYTQALLGVGKSQITFQTNLPGAGEIFVDNTPFNVADTINDYFSDVSLTIKASANAGYRLSGWKVNGSDVNTDALTLTPAGQTVTAVFIEDAGSGGGSASLVINEAMGSNQGAVLDDEGNTGSDWIEIKNTGTSAVDIKNFKIGDSNPSPSIHTFSQSHIIPAGGYLVIWATNNSSGNNDLHTNFAISNSGETLTLTDDKGHVLDILATGPFTTNKSKGRSPDGAGAWTELLIESHGATNTPIGNQPPVVSNINNQTVGSGQELDISVSAIDIDGDSLSYSVTSTPATFTHFSVSGNVIHLAPVASEEGSYTLTVAVDDGQGHVVTKSFSLTVTNVPVEPIYIVINEVMADNEGIVVDDLGNTTSDWIELKNTGSNAVDIKNFQITDGSASVWTFNESHVIAPGGYLVVWATNNTGSQNDLHTNFALSKGGGETITFKDGSGNVLDFQTTGTFDPNQSKGRIPDGSGSTIALEDPSPGVNNSLANRKPIVQSISAKFIKQGRTLDVTVNAVDSDNDALTYTVVPGSGFTNFSITGNVVHLTPQSTDVGSYALTVKVDDGNRHPVSTTFGLTVTDGTIPVVINETMGINTSTIKDENNRFSTWLELANTGSSSIDLSGFTLSNLISTWAFSSGTSIAAGGHLIVWATGADNPPVNGWREDHANFVLNPSGDTLTLKDTDGDVISQVNTGVFKANVSRGRASDGNGSFVALQTPTPKTSNSITRINQAPVVLDIANTSVEQGQSLDITINATDTDDDPLTYTVTSSGAFTNFSINGAVIHLTPVFSEVGGPPYTLNVSVNDGQGHIVTKTFQVTVTASNQAPVVQSITDQIIQQGETLDVTVLASDVDGDTLTYNVSSSSGVFTNFSMNNNVIHFAPVLSEAGGPYTLTISVDDGHGHVTNQSFQVTITNIIVELPSIVINEIMGYNSQAIDQNGNYIWDENYNFSNWIEIKNTGVTAVDLTGVTLSDLKPSTTTWTFPAGATIPPGGYLMIWATGDDAPPPEGWSALHTNFYISDSGETFTLKDNQGREIDQIVSGSFQPDVSIGRQPDGTGAMETLAIPTPGANNTVVIAQAASFLKTAKSVAPILELVNQEASDPISKQETIVAPRSSIVIENPKMVQLVTAPLLESIQQDKSVSIVPLQAEADSVVVGKKEEKSADSTINKSTSIKFSPRTRRENRTTDIRFKNDLLNRGAIQINNVRMNQTRLEGKYFKGTSIKIKALPRPGFKFDSWRINGEVVSEETLNINPEKTSSVEVFFQKDTGINNFSSVATLLNRYRSN